jgi:hypothetical protein
MQDALIDVERQRIRELGSQPVRSSPSLFLRNLPTAFVLAAAVAMVLHGPIAQNAGYHYFADRRAWLAIPNALDVLSNVGFAVIGAYGLYRLWPRRNHRAIVTGWPGLALFLAALVLTALGSAFYHLAPDDSRLIWDRLPIALACAGLLAGVRTQVRPNVNGALMTGLLTLVAIASVFWWYVTGINGAGDLRPYLLLQASPLVLIPLWQAIYTAPRADRISFAAAVALYVAAKATELLDHQLFASLHWVSGHTLKHLLATAAAAVIVSRLVRQCARR